MLGRCSVDTVEWSIDSLFSIPGRSSCMPGCQIEACCLIQLIGVYRTSDNILLDELSDVLIFNQCESLGLYPLVEIINGYKQQFFLCQGGKERPNYVSSPLSERARARDGN